MNCASCGFQIESGFAFCPKCGAKQPRPCLSCGYLCAADFSFCPKCGAGFAAATTANTVSPPLPSIQSLLPNGAAANEGAPHSPHHTAEPEADRRTITILFADLSGFTALSERLDPEVMQGLQNELFEELTTAVQSVGGFVDKFIGDALLALFGAPVAHEDDPERALRAALDMIERTGCVGERSKVLAGLPLELHIGINTGPVVTGGFGVGNAKSYSVTGDTVNTAQRLQSLAAPGEVLVGPLTYRLTRHAFSYESLGDIALRGKAGSVLVHRLAGPLEAPRAARGLDALGLGAPLIGRVAELGRMLGEPRPGVRGLGSTRAPGRRGRHRQIAASERVRRARPRRGAFCECCRAAEHVFAARRAILWRARRGRAQRRWHDAGRPARGYSGEARRAARPSSALRAKRPERLRPLLFHVLGIGDPDGTLAPCRAGAAAAADFYAIRTIIERRLALSPLLIVVEDLHWADAVSLEALRFVMDRLERSRLMLVVTHRPAMENDQLDSTRVSHTALRLAPLNPAEGERLLGALFGDLWRGSAGNLRDRILDRAGGNPLFIEEIVRGLIDGGVLKRDGAQWQIASDEAAAGIPASIQAMLLARVDRLPQEVRRLAQEAAVIGPRFDAPCSGRSPPIQRKLEAGLEMLCDFELIEEVPERARLPRRTTASRRPCCRT